jgi:hypothetical protein
VKGTANLPNEIHRGETDSMVNQALKHFLDDQLPLTELLLENEGL